MATLICRGRQKIAATYRRGETPLARSAARRSSYFSYGSSFLKSLVRLRSSHDITILSAFRTLGIPADLVEGLKELGIITPTEVQEKTIPFLIKNGGWIALAHENGFQETVDSRLGDCTDTGAGETDW